MTRAYEMFATRSDLLDLLDSVEALRSIQYIKLGLRSCVDPIVATSVHSIENFGIATFGDQNLEPMYLILDSSESVNVKRITQRRGGVKYKVGQAENPRSVTLKVGGEYKNEALIAGQIGTVTNDKGSISLLQLFEQELRKNFEIIKNNYIGKGAARALDSGARLTANVRTPTQFDLRRD